MSNTAVTKASDFAEIETLAQHGAMVFAGAPSITQSMELAATVEQLRAQLTPQRMAKVLALMNTSLGFDTDRNPAKWKKPEPCVPYSVEVVRDVFIEATLRGFYPINCEFNIIAGKFYGGLNGFERLVKKHPKVTDFQDWFGIPKMAQTGGGAVVEAKATWLQDGQKQTLNREFAVRVNDGMGADAIIGKAKRKLYAAVYGRLSGVVTPEGEAGDELSGDLKGASSTAAPTSTDKLFGSRAADATGTTAKTPAGKKTEPTPETTAPATPNPTPEGMTPKAELIHTLTSSGVTFDDFRDFVKVKNLARDPEAWGSYDDLPEKVVEWFKKNPKTLAECIKTFGNLQAK